MDSLYVVYCSYYYDNRSAVLDAGVHPVFANTDRLQGISN